MNLATLLLGCSVHMDDPLLLSVIHAHSSGNPYAVMNVDVAVLDGQDEPASMVTPPSSRPTARDAVSRVLAAGGAPVVGLLPVRPQWAAEFGKTLEELFDPCNNVAVASAKVSEFDYLCRGTGPHLSASVRRACTLDRYGASVGLPALRIVVMADLKLRDTWPPQSTFAGSVLAPTEHRSELFFSIGHLPPARPLDGGSLP